MLESSITMHVKPINHKTSKASDDASEYCGGGTSNFVSSSDMETIEKVFRELLINSDISFTVYFCVPGEMVKEINIGDHEVKSFRNLHGVHDVSTFATWWIFCARYSLDIVCIARVLTASWHFIV